MLPELGTCRETSTSEGDEMQEKFDIFGAIIDGAIVKNVPFEPNGDFLGFFIKPKVKTDESD